MRLHLECIDWPEPGSGYQPEFVQIQDQSYECKRVPVDNHQYKNCVFENCTFVYSGGPFGFQDCEVRGDYSLGLTGAAHRSEELWTQFQEHLRKVTPPY
jgi:hypothetical protein